MKWWTLTHSQQSMVGECPVPACDGNAFYAFGSSVYEIDKIRKLDGQAPWHGEALFCGTCGNKIEKESCDLSLAKEVTDEGQLWMLNSRGDQPKAIDFLKKIGDPGGPAPKTAGGWPVEEIRVYPGRGAWVMLTNPSRNRTVMGIALEDGFFHEHAYEPMFMQQHGFVDEWRLVRVPDNVPFDMERYEREKIGGIE